MRRLHSLLCVWFCGHMLSYPSAPSPPSLILRDPLLLASPLREQSVDVRGLGLGVLAVPLEERAQPYYDSYS